MRKSSNVLSSIFIVALIMSFIVNKSISQVTDVDGNSYKTVTIGKQVWMAENLNVEHYRNGDVIPQVQDSTEWSNLTTGAWCYYENNSENGKTYSKLYNWFAVNDPRGLALKGWHIPSDAEWTKLTNFLGGEKVAGGKLKATTLWETPNEGVTNESGFTALPGGFRSFLANFDFIYKFGCFWSSSGGDNVDLDSGLAWPRTLSNNSTSVYNYGYNKGYGLSVRCVKD